MENRFYAWLRRNAGYIIVILTVVAYVGASFIRINETGKTVAEIIADGAVSMIIGFLISRFFELQGIVNSENDEKVIATNRLHGEVVMRISPYLDQLDDWCEKKNKENLKMQRIKVLATEGLKYADYFDEEGDARDYTPKYEGKANKSLASAEKRRYKCFTKALHIKLTPITAGALTSEGTHPDDIYNFGRTKQEYQRESTLGDILSRLAFAVVFGYFGVEQIIDFSYANLIWKCLQLTVFLLSGVLKLFMSRIYMTDENRGRTIKKIDNLTMFENYIKEQSKNVNDNEKES